MKRETVEHGTEIDRARCGLGKGSRVHLINILRHHGVARDESSDEYGMKRETVAQGTEICRGAREGSRAHIANNSRQHTAQDDARKESSRALLGSTTPEVMIDLVGECSEGGAGPPLGVA